MFDKIKEYFLGSTEKDIAKYQELKKSISDNRNVLGVLVGEYHETRLYCSNGTCELEKSECADAKFLREKIDENFNTYFTSYIKQVAEIKKSIERSESEIGKLLGKNENLKEAIEKARMPEKYNKGCLMLETSIPNWNDVLDKVSDSDVYEKPGFGKEDEQHTTVLYGFDMDKVEPSEVRGVVSDSDRDGVSFKIKDVSLFENDKFDVLKFGLESKDLNELNKESKKLPFDNDYPDYHPHITIAYLKKGRGKDYLDKFNDLVSKEFTSKSFMYSYSPKEGGKLKDKFSIENIKKSEKVSQSHLEEMIEEHERLVSLLEKHKDQPDIAKELTTQIKELADYKKQLAALTILEKAFEGGQISSETLEKARKGVYKDTSENRKLKRVGQPYGSKKEDVPTVNKAPKKDENKPVGDAKQENGEVTPEAKQNLAEHAKATSESDLQNAVKTSSDPEVRKQAHEELDRRTKEEHVQEEEKPVKTESNKESTDKEKVSDKKEGSAESESNKKDGELTPEQRKENFNKWFGDSKVVDENGAPLKVYHGTRSKFSEFSNDMIASGTGNYGHMGLGFYFSFDKRESESYGNNVMETYLSIKNPFVANDENLDKYAENFGYEKKPVSIDKDWFLSNLKNKDVVSYNLANSIIENGYEKGWSKFLKTNKFDDAKMDLNDVNYMVEMVSPEYKQELSEDSLSLFKEISNEPPKVNMDYEDGDRPNLVYMTGLGDYSASKEFTDMLKKDGYDGVISGSEIVAFEPNQIKSATGNDGNFDPKSNDITKSE